MMEIKIRELENGWFVRAEKYVGKPHVVEVFTKDPGDVVNHILQSVRQADEGMEDYDPFYLLRAAPVVVSVTSGAWNKR